jgi:hypothetical protein
MSLRYFPILIALLAGAAALHAAGPPKTDADKNADTAKNEVIPPYELKNHSSFVSPTEITRVPFWPIGWVKRTAYTPAAVAIQEAPKVLLDEKAFRITSILIGTGSTPSLAVINGRAYSEGEFVRMPKTPGVAPIRVRVQRINDGTVILQHADQIMVAILQRPELSNRKPDEQLLDPDR